MDILNIDIKSLLPDIIEVYVYIYGEEYRSVIEDRINKTLILSYHDPDGVENYAKFLKAFKRRELSLEFLNRIGIDITKYKVDNYTQPLDNEVELLLRPYVCSSDLAFSGANDYFAPLRAFGPNNVTDERVLLRNRIELINHLRGIDKEPITIYNFSAFTETAEYLELLNKINEINIIYNEILSNYSEYEKSVKPYEDYAKNEEKRKEDILWKKTEELFVEVLPYLPEEIKAVFEGKSIEEQQEMFFSKIDVSSSFYLELFDLKTMEKLLSPEKAKSLIAIYQTSYLSNMGIDISEFCALDIATEEGIKKHLELLKQKAIKDLIPSEELINQIKVMREKKYQEGLEEYYKTRTDFIELTKDCSEKASEAVYIFIKEKKICVYDGSKNGDFASALFYTVRAEEVGYLFGVLLHEFGHVIDNSEKGCGFEPKKYMNNTREMNPYDKTQRKYERFNETITDMFMMEAKDVLQSRGIYHIEPKPLVRTDINDWNTYNVTKQLLKPLVKKFRKAIIGVRISADQTRLTKYIGVSNFEALVDVVNKVDYLLRNGLDIQNMKQDNPIVIQYQEQVERANQIYANIDLYAMQHIEISTITASSIQTTESRKI